MNVKLEKGNKPNRKALLRPSGAARWVGWFSANPYITSRLDTTTANTTATARTDSTGASPTENVLLFRRRQLYPVQLKLGNALAMISGKCLPGTGTVKFVGYLLGAMAVS